MKEILKDQVLANSFRKQTGSSIKYMMTKFIKN